MKGITESFEHGTGIVPISGAFAWPTSGKQAKKKKKKKKTHKKKTNKQKTDDILKYILSKV